MPFSTNMSVSENFQILYNCIIVYFTTLYDILAKQIHNSLHIYKKSGIFYEPSMSLETNESEISQNIKLVSFNIDDLACHSPKYGKNSLARATKIINYLESINADIICLQEIWSETMKQEISDAFLAKNYYVALPHWRKNYIFGENSGLITISKYPIITQTFLPFNNPRGICRLFNKGVQYCHIRVPNSNPDTSIELNIANTHLQASFTKYSSYLNFQETAKKQLTTIINECPYESCLLIGDLNLKKENLDEFINNESKIQYFGENSEITYPECNNRLDYTLKITKLANKQSITQNITNKTESHIDLSDHFPIISEFSLKSSLSPSPSPPSPPPPSPSSSPSSSSPSSSSRRTSP